MAELGEVHFGRKAIQPARAAVREFYAVAAPRLQHDVVGFDADQRESIGAALEAVIRETPLTCWACAVLTDHVHLVIRKHRQRAEEMLERLQVASREALREAGLVPPKHPVWTNGGWRKFLDSPAAIRRTVGYVERNPIKEGLPAQVWPFVKTYDGWSFGG